MFGYAADAFQLWSLREWLLSVGGTAVITGLTWLVAFIAPLPRLPLYLVVGGSLLLAFWILTVIAENRRVRRITSATQSAARRDTTGTTIIEFIENANISVASATQPAQQETTAKRKAANDLLGNALEEGERLRQGRSMGGPNLRPD